MLRLLTRAKTKPVYLPPAAAGASEAGAAKVMVAISRGGVRESKMKEAKVSPNQATGLLRGFRARRIEAAAMFTRPEA